MRQLKARVAGYWIGLCVLLVSSALHAQTVTTVYGPFSVTSTSGTQLSNVLYTINVSTAGTLLVQYTASAGHCSNVRAHILVDGVERGVTAFLTPGQASGFLNVGPVSAGAHVVALQGEGTVGGCNAGVLVGWGGTASVTVDGVAAAIPAPGWLLATLALLAGIGLFGPWRRRS